MIGCLLLGTFVAMGAARLIRHRCGWGGPCGAHWRGGFGGPYPGGMRAFHRHGWMTGPGPDCGHGPGGGYGRGYGPGDPLNEGEPFGASSGHEDDPGDSHGEPGWERFGRASSGRRAHFILRAILGQVRATATQERVIRAAVDEFRDELKEAGGGEAKKSRQDIGGALRKPHFDEVFMGELFARQDTAIERTRKAFVGLMAKVHETLDEEQRGRLSELVEKGPRFWRRGMGW